MASEEMILRMFDLLGEIWPRDAERISPLTIEVYSRVLADVDDRTLQAAVVKIVSEATFWPKPAEMRAACLTLTRPEIPTAHQAWAEVKAHLRAGHSKDPWHPLTWEALEGIGGWQSFAMSQREDESYWLTHFVKSYDALAGRERERQRMLPEVRQAISAIAESKRILAPARRQLEAAS